MQIWQASVEYIKYGLDGTIFADCTLKSSAFGGGVSAVRPASASGRKPRSETSSGSRSRCAATALTGCGAGCACAHACSRCSASRNRPSSGPPDALGLRRSTPSRCPHQTPKSS